MRRVTGNTTSILTHLRTPSPVPVYARLKTPLAAVPLTLPLALGGWLDECARGSAAGHRRGGAGQAIHVTFT